MIVRILGEGQYDLADGELDALNKLDVDVTQAVDTNDEPRFEQALAALLDHVRKSGVHVPDDALVSSDLILPGPDADLTEVGELLGDEGLIPG